MKEYNITVTSVIITQQTEKKIKLNQKYRYEETLSYTNFLVHFNSLYYKVQKLFFKKNIEILNLKTTRKKENADTGRHLSYYQP